MAKTSAGPSSTTEAAFPASRALSAKERTSILTKFANLLLEYSTHLAELTRITLGALISTFGSIETALAATTWLYNADGFLKIVRHEPLGVVAGIVPWNGPMGTAALKGAPALATGNCFILKPSEKTLFAALAMGPLIKEAAFPPGVFQVLSGEPSCRDDADLDNAVKWCADAITANTGQVCFAASRVYVQEGLADRFNAAYKTAMTEKASTAGDPEDLKTLLGPVVDNARFERVMGFIKRDQQQNA
ncbi:hypothetical protein AJ80_01302 [Polytolypa hystricis UAMH7299]|uniref:aldehyde dehydrogenase (NAD(+)) n=1 Tax=Polytolypa hystricis (strain UAMH7299) TaxID=1447883 RepID=A0A2B7Z0S5_POLH7|nr:hypothetical protein AJ80_01302 [Polytolypa hystricis UAMH7299]